jgi:ATP-dependent RNA helicase DDX5/DBP2
MIGVAKTGSGKTCGYLLPGFMHVQKLLGLRPSIRRGDGPVVLVLAPTRELAVQIEQECLKFGRSSGIMSVCVYGGAPKWPQKNKLQNGIHVMIGTPGRINDFLEAKPSPVILSRTSYLVLDEADRMLDMGFEPQIRSIIAKLPPHQTLMFTATWPLTVAKLAREFLRNPIQINIGSIELKANTDVTQHIHQVKESEKSEKLVKILSEIKDPKASVIVFCNKKADCDALANAIYQAGWGAQSIHGDKEQWQRQQALDRFTRGQDPVIVATDVAARGLDIKGVSHVINYDFPPSGVENWVHRVGRTGRAGATGIAHTFFDDYGDRKHAKEFVKVLKGSNQEIPPWLQSLSYQFFPSKKSWNGGSGSWGGGRGRGGRGRGGNWGGRGSWGGGSWGGRGDRQI